MSGHGRRDQARKNDKPHRRSSDEVCVCLWGGGGGVELEK